MALSAVCLTPWSRRSPCQSTLLTAIYWARKKRAVTLSRCHFNLSAEVKFHTK